MVGTRLGWGALALALGLFATAQAHAAGDGACRLLMAASLTMKSDVAGRPLVPVRLDGHGKMLLVDTGAVYTMLTEETVAELKLPGGSVRPREFIFVNGASAEQSARVRSFHLGRLPFGAFTFLVTPASLRIPGASGALGPDIMRYFDVEFDFARGKLNLFSQDHCDGGVVYWTQQPHTSLSFMPDDSWHLTAVAMLDGHLVDVLIDTGSVGTTMTLEDARQEFGIGPNSPGMRRLDDGGGNPRNAIYAYSFGALNLQGIAVDRPTITIRPDRTGMPPSGLRPELILGMTVLSKLHLYVAYKERKIYITGAGAR